VDKIIIKDLEVEAQIGVTSEERSYNQRLLITIEIERELAEAGRSDVESVTTGYDVVSDLVRQVVSERPRKLIEAVAHDIASVILTRRWAVAVSIEVKKFSIPRTQYVSVFIRRTQ
jgi:7,8-dihydroneopterin aldolase/epimerase/oxygenase